MFTWICPQCGREVPPSYNECPDCAAKSKAAAPAPPPGPPPAEIQPAPPPAPVEPPPYHPAPPPQPPAQQYPPSQQQYPQPPYPPPQQYPPPPYGQQPYPPQQQYPPQYQQQYQAPPQPYYGAPPPRAGMPTWLMSILSALAFGAVVLGAYYFLGNSKKEPASASVENGPVLENPPTASGALKNNPVLKQVEVVGLRLTQNKAKKTEVRFLLVNHSAAEIPDVSGKVTLGARTRKSDEEQVGSFSFKAASLGPYESKEMTVPVNTKLKVYELPDWQNLQTQIEFTP